MHLTTEQASELYSQYYGNPMFPLLVATSSSAPIIVLFLAKVNAVQELRKLAGPHDVEEAKIFYPESLNAKYGTFREQEGCNFNCVYASCSEIIAEKEIKFFFPQGIVNKLIKIITDLNNFL